MAWTCDRITPAGLHCNMGSSEETSSGAGTTNVIQYEGLSVSVTKRDWRCRTRRRDIFTDLSGCIQRGATTAILGPSGAGKTTFLDTLAKRLPSSMRTSGSVTYIADTGERGSGLSSVKAAYVKQADVLMASATVREAVLTSAHLRLPQLMSPKAKAEKTDFLLKLLGLWHVRKSRIGNEYRRGISGGEMKRTAIAVELVTDPGVVFLDEPSSGLDSAMALSVVRTLKKLSRAGRSIVCTIHQPRSNIFDLFDNVILLAPGGVAYDGPARDVTAYFAGLQPPVLSKLHYVNPADFMIDILCDDAGIVSEERYLPLMEQYKENKAQLDEVVARGGEVLSPPKIAESDAVAEVVMEKKKGIRGFMQSLFKAPKTGISSSDTSNTSNNSVIDDTGTLMKDIDESQSGEESAGGLHAQMKLHPISSGHSIAPWQLWILLLRAFRNSYRNPEILVTEAIQYIMFGLLYGLLYYDQGFDQDGVRNRAAALYFLAICAIFFAGMSVITTFPSERALFNRERASKAYSTMPFYSAYCLVDAPRQVFWAVVYSLMTYFTIGLDSSVDKVFIYIVTMALLLQCASSYALCISAAVPNVEVGTILLSFGIVVWISFGGLLLTDDRTPVYFYPFLYTSPVRYAFQAMMINEFKGQTGYTCNKSHCPYTEGEDILRQYSFENNEIWEGIVVVAAITIFHRILGYLILRFYRPGQS